MEETFNLRSWLAWLVKVRIIIITFLFGIGLLIVRLTPTNTPVRLFVAVILLWYTIAVFYVALLGIWRDYGLQARLQVLTDLGMATILVYVTGGIDTSFNFLFPLLVIVAAILLPRWWAYVTAALSFIAFGAVLELTYFGWIRSFQISAKGDLNSLQGVILINLFAYISIAYLASTLVQKLRQVDIELQDKSGALQSLQALHQNIIDSMHGGLITTDLEGRITLLNQPGEKLLELEESKVLGRTVNTIFLDRLPDVKTAMTHGEVRSLAPSGSAKTFAMTVSALTVPDRGVVGYVYSFDDRTEVKRLEREVRMRDRLSAVGRMAAGIAHEIRNPLAAIAGSVSVLRGISTLSEDQKTLLDIVTKESDRLNHIISDFLIYSRDTNYKFSQVDLCALLQETVRLLENRPEVQARRIRVQSDISPMEAWIEADGDKLKQVFWNLIENAIRAMPEDGTLGIQLVQGEEPGSWQASFRDSGKGMRPEQLEKAFEPFQSSFAGGTGLGLAIVYQIVQAHRGKIWIRSKEQEGTEVFMEFQAASRAQASAEPKVKVAHG